MQLTAVPSAWLAVLVMLLLLGVLVQPMAHAAPTTLTQTRAGAKQTPQDDDIMRNDRALQWLRQMIAEQDFSAPPSSPDALLVSDSALQTSNAFHAADKRQTMQQQQGDSLLVAQPIRANGWVSMEPASPSSSSSSSYAPQASSTVYQPRGAYRALVDDFKTWAYATNPSRHGRAFKPKLMSTARGFGKRTPIIGLSLAPSYVAELAAAASLLR